MLVMCPISVKNKICVTGLALENGSMFFIVSSEAAYTTFLSQKTALTKIQYIINSLHSFDTY